MLLLIALACAGCSRPPFPVAEVRGSVSIDGQPMTQGKVMFAPIARDGVNSGRPAFGTIQPDGTFTLSTYSDGDGAVVGDHWVSVVNDTATAGITQAKDGGGKVTKANFKQVRFPRQTVAVVAGEVNQIDIQMTSQDIAKYGRKAAEED